MKQIDIIIGPDGNPTIETSGFVGGECAKETADLERALGGKVKDTKTAEYYKTEQSGLKQK